MARETVLVVDDEEDILELVKYNLEKEGYTVVCVATGEDALAATRMKMPDLLVLDLMLPGVDGLEVCRRLKGDLTTRSRPDHHADRQGQRSRHRHRPRARRRRTT